MVGGELDNGRQKTRNHGYDVIVGGELFTDYSDHPRKLVTLNPNQINRRRTLPASFPLVGCLPQAAYLKDFPKSQDRQHCSRLRSVALYLWLIVADIRQAIDRCSNIWASSAGRWLAWSVRAQVGLTAWLQNSKKRAERSGEIDVWAESLRLSPLWLSASSSACHGLLIITVITTCTKPSAKKCQRTEDHERGNYRHADASAQMLLRSMQNTRRS